MMSLHSNRKVTKISLVTLGMGNQSIPIGLTLTQKQPASCWHHSGLLPTQPSRTQFTSPACHRSLCPKDLCFHLPETRMFTPER